MAEVITKLVSVEKKPGSNANGAFVLTKFTAADGKKYQTFDEELAAKVENQLMNIDGVKIVFEVQSRTNQGRTFTNNSMTDAFISGNETAAASGAASGGGSGRGASAVTPNGKLAALGPAVTVGLYLIESGQVESLDFSGFTQIADMFVAWANGEIAGADPEDIAPPEPAAEVVPD